MSDETERMKALNALVGDVDEIKRRLVDLQAEAEAQTSLLRSQNDLLEKIAKK